ncbi:hypothetical protein [Desulfotomaculum copahuensis]|uniref:Glycosyl transferase family 1 domain-containing protein n=1 Tax=Desulfotomaculum copahuensis TaxID=1838280 RepID=A0A1B7LEY6_9FIRM|nr:hypothetical protein A6M21_10390 [Desulfotomaculum copahuensis]
MVTPTGGLAFQVQKGRTGLRAGPVEELAARIGQLLDNPSLGRRLGAAVLSCRYTCITGCI